MATNYTIKLGNYTINLEDECCSCDCEYIFADLTKGKREIDAAIGSNILRVFERTDEEMIIDEDDVRQISDMANLSFKVSAIIRSYEKKCQNV